MKKKILGVASIVGLLAVGFVSYIAPLSKVNAQVMVGVSINESPNTICAGETANLSWNSTNAESVSIDQGIGSVGASGDLNVSPTQTTTYSILATNSSGGYATGAATVNVSGTCNSYSYQSPNSYSYQSPYSSPYASPYGSPYASPYASPYSTPAIYTYPSPYTTPYQTPAAPIINNNNTNTNTNNNIINAYPTPSSAASYTYQSPYSYQTPITYSYQTPLSYSYQTPFTALNNQPTVDVYADETSIAYNGSTFVRWTTTNATSCVASGGSIGWAGTKSIGPGTFFTGSLTGTRTYTLTCTNNFGSATDSATVNVRAQSISTTTVVNTRAVAPSSLVLITSSVDRNQPILPTLDNTRPRPGDEINYTVTYQNIGNAAVTNLTLRIDLPYEVDYMFSNPSNPIRSGNTLIFNLGTLRANGEGTVTVRVRVRENIQPGTNLNFPAMLSYTDPNGFPQSVTANVSAQVWRDGEVVNDNLFLGANVFGSGFLPGSLFGWLLLIVLILLLVMLVQRLFPPAPVIVRDDHTIHH